VLLGVLLVGVLVSEAGALQIPSEMKLGDTTLVLNGQGFRETWFTKVYHVALYLSERTVDPHIIRESKAPKAIRLTVTYNGNMADGIPDNWQEEIWPEVSQAQKKKLQNAYADLKEGDTVLITYHPQAGCTVLRGTHEVLIDSGRGLMDGFLTLWIGPEPVSENIKRLLLHRP
jgi:hypothetical protein